MKNLNDRILKITFRINKKSLKIINKEIDFFRINDKLNGIVDMLNQNLL